MFLHIQKGVKKLFLLTTINLILPFQAKGQTHTRLHHCNILGIDIRNQTVIEQFCFRQITKPAR